MRARLALGAALALLPALAAAEPAKELQATRAQLEQAKTRAEALARQAKKLEEERNALSTQLAKLAETIQLREKELFSLEESLAVLEAQAGEKEAALSARKAQISAMVSSAIALSRMPPEAAVMMPGDPTRVIEAARAVKMMAESLRAQAGVLADDIRELARLKEEADSERKQVKDALDALQKEQAALDEKIKTRAELSAKTNRDAAEEERKARQLSKKYEDLQSLLYALERERKEQEARAAREAEAKAQEAKEKETQKKAVREEARAKGRAFASAKGRVRPPAAGKLLKPYGEVRKGIVFQTRDNALVTAPYDGEVVFTGPFLTYGRIVILRHAGGFHTLLAGLASFDAKAGEFLLEGEPIGAMGEGKDNTRLYLELRKDNQPIDPTPWIAGLK